MNSPRPRVLVKQDNAPHYFFAPCPRGLAGVLADELGELGAKDAKAGDAGVAFSGPFDLIYRTNLHSRIASRILWRVASGPYATEDDVHALAAGVQWSHHFNADRTIKVETNAHRSPLRSLDFITLRVKDAIVDQFRGATGKRPSVETRDPDIRVHVFLDAKLATLYIDTSGDSLFKRGRRDHVGEAPLKKNLAAGILRLAGWKPGIALLDPMCGAGTFLTEAAEMSLGRAAGGERDFAFTRLSRYNEATWDRARGEAALAERDPEPLPIFGSDLYGRSLGHAAMNLKEAGLENSVQLKQANLLEISPPVPEGMIVTNPPYGVRLGEKEQLQAFYPELGNALKQRFPGWVAHIFTGDPDLAKLIRLQPTKKPVLYNGALECRLYEYRLVAGGNRKR
jgi:putative N6-adenine-specific DNA methylase